MPHKKQFKAASKSKDSTTQNQETSQASEGWLTDNPTSSSSERSFYNSAGDETPIKTHKSKEDKKKDAAKKSTQEEATKNDEVSNEEDDQNKERSSSKATQSPISTSTASKERPPKRKIRKEVPGFEPDRVKNFCDKDGKFIIPNELPTFFFMLTAQERPAVVYDGYYFYSNNIFRSGAIKHFKCEHKGCPSMVVTNQFESLKTPPEEHAHPPPKDLFKRLLEWYLINNIPLKSNMSSSDIATHALANLNDPQQSMVHTYQQLVRFITNKRRDASIPTSNPETARDLVIDDQLKHANDESLFLLHEDPKEIEERMIIYATKKNMQVIKDQEVWLSDATFASCPKIFNQLWVIHAEVEERVVPLIYCLMIGTKSESYVRALKIIKQEMQKIALEENEAKATSAGRPPKDPISSIRLKNPKVVLLDFEAAQSMAFKEVFGCATQGCYFHFRQACLRKLKTFKELYKKYTSDTSGITKQMVGRYPAMCFLKKDDILKAVKLLDVDEWNVANRELMAGFVEYFKDQWTGKFVEKRYGPGKNKISWNYVESVLTEGTKTTSTLEGWHNHFAKSVGVCKPSFGKLFVGLKKSKDRADKTLRDIENGVPPPSKKSQHELKKDTMYNLVSRGYKKDEMMEYLKRVSNAMNFGFE